jgi:uncharacterized protein YndB with AHSA1/START domain
VTAQHFALSSRWHIAAPRARVWNALLAPHEWPRWWPYVAQVREIATGNADGINAQHHFTWRSRLPYGVRITMTVDELRHEETLAAQASGDLDGDGRWTLRDSAAGGTALDYEWNVRVERAWMRAFAPLLRPVFAWNHDVVMAAGERGLQRWLNAPAARAAR